jgi:hypothetical protein
MYNEMSGVCSMHGSDKKCVNILAVRFEEMRPLGTRHD